MSGWNFLLHIYVVSVSNHERLNDGWVCGLAKKLRHETLPENMMNCNCIVDWEHSLLVFNIVYALYFDVVMNCNFLMRSFMTKFIVVIIISMMPLCPYFVFYRHLSLNLNMWAWFSISALLEDKRGLSLGELICSYCIMFSY